jgi:hypothetical protein
MSAVSSLDRSCLLCSTASGVWRARLVRPHAKGGPIEGFVCGSCPILAGPGLAAHGARLVILGAAAPAQPFGQVRDIQKKSDEVSLFRGAIGPLATTSL